MIEDKLSHDERLKLECISQAVAMRVGYVSACPTPDEIVDIATTFEQHLSTHLEGHEFTSVDLYAAIKTARVMPDSSADEIIDKIREMKEAKTTDA